ncbi:MAG: hypothetical protein ACTHME_00570 [Candidatus Nitrosocosmicus sp.]
MNDNNESSFSSLLKYKHYDAKKGIVFGALGGFVAAIAFTGLILCMSSFFNHPEGTFFDSIGISIVNNNSIVSIGLGSLAIILTQGIIIGILLGLIISVIKPLNPASRKKGVGLGLLAGFISFIILYLPMVSLSSIYSNLITKTLSAFSSSTFLATRGIESTLSNNMPIEGMLIWGLISYLVFGFITGGIITLAYSIYNFDRKEIEKAEKK